MFFQFFFFKKNFFHSVTNLFYLDEKSIVDVETEGNLSRMLSDIDLSRKRKRNSSDDDEPSRKYQGNI